MTEPKARIQNFEAFWPYYLREHGKPATRWMHWIGTNLAVLTLVNAVVGGRPLYALWALLPGYGFAWVSHFFIEKNRPATFTYPLWSLIGDFKMWGLMWTGRIRGEVERHVGVGELTMKKVVELFWDVASPYTYLAHTQMAGLEARTGAEVRYRPFLLGGVFKATENLMPGANPYKAAYLVKDLARWRDHYRVPMKMPALEVIFPVNSLLPMRLATAADLAGQGRALAQAFFHAYWVQGRNVGDEAEAKVVVGEAGLDVAALFAAAQSGVVKDRLRANTEEAVSRGAFGAPAIFVGDQLYFGNDRLMFVEAALQG